MNFEYFTLLRRTLIFGCLCIGLCLLLCVRPAQAVSLETDLGFLAVFSFENLPWPTSLQKNNPQIKVETKQVPVWKTAWDKARAYAIAGDLKTSVDTYRRALAIKPDLDAANWELANILFALAHYQEAQKIVEILVEHDPEKLEYLNGLAVLDLKVGKFPLAADLFVRIHKRTPQNVNALAGAVYGYLMAKHPKAALPVLKKLAVLVPDSPGLRQNLGLLAYKEGDYETAAGQFMPLMIDDAVDPQILLYTARSLDHLGQDKQAAGYWQRLLLKEPGMIEAHQWLACYFEQDGQVEKALPHLLFLNEHKPNDPSLLKRLGQCYVGLKEFHKALENFQKYLLIKPDDTEVARFVVSLQAALGNKSEILGALKHYIKIEAHPDKANLEKAAKLYGEKGLFRQALGIWQKLLALTPDDPEILGAMAHNFLAIGKNEAALKVWKKLAKVSPNVIEVYRPMADLLEKMGRQQELIEVLETIHDLRPNEQNITLKLAGLYLRRQDYTQAGKLLGQLAKAGCQKPEFFYLRAEWAERGNDFLLALHEYDKFLKTAPERQDVRTRCMVLAGRMGKLALVQRYFETLTEALSVSTDLQLQAAEAFENCGSYDKSAAIFKHILNVAVKTAGWPMVNSAGPQAGKAAWHLADIYEDEGDEYAAKKFLLMGLVISNNKPVFLQKLLAGSLDSADVREAEHWNNLLQKQKNVDSWYLSLWEAKLQHLQGNFRQVSRLVHYLSKKLDGGVAAKNLPDWSNKSLQLANFLKIIDPEQATARCRAVLAKEPRNLRAMVALASLGRTTRSCMINEFDKLTAVELLDYARLAKKNGRPWLMERVAKLAYAKMPDSLMAAILLAQAPTMRGEVSSSAKAWAELARANPGNSFIAGQGAESAFLNGEMDRAMALCRAVQPQRPAMVLLEARILWMQNKWSAALTIYKNFLKPGVDELLGKAGKELGVLLPMPVQKRSFMQRVSLAPAKNAPVADLLMKASSFSKTDLSRKARSFQLATARLYALYRWQDKFSAELSVRKSVYRRAYFMAQQRYEALIEKFPADKSLMFDLAAIYSQLGRLDDEAGIYDDLLAAGIKFPGLLDDAQRNKLKKRPQGTIAFDYRESEGRNGYKDMRINSEKLAFRVSPRTGEKFKLHLVRNNYHGVNSDGTIRSAKVMAAYQAKLLNRLTVNLGGGVESLDRSGMNTALFNLQIDGKLGDKFSARGFFRRDVVADTLVSIDRGINKQDLGAGLSFEPLSRLALGGDYDHIKYSDNNWTTNDDLWSSLLIHSEPLFLQLKYKYEFKKSADGTGSGQNLNDTLPLGVHPYWSPKNYWTNQFGVYFKHFLSHERLNRDIPKYYTIEYYLGHDSDGYAFQSAKSNFCLEFSSHFTAQARVELFSSSVYRKKQFALSASYRW